jgi:hypothetical protein
MWHWDSQAVDPDFFFSSGTRLRSPLDAGSQQVTRISDYNLRSIHLSYIVYNSIYQHTYAFIIYTSHNSTNILMTFDS